MNQVAFILGNTTVGWYSVILSLALLTGVCVFAYCSEERQLERACSATALMLALVLSTLLSRLLYWNCRPDSFSSVAQAFTVPFAQGYALAGVFAGCGIGVLAAGRKKRLGDLADCTSLGLCAAIALGRLGNFFTSSDRGQILTELRSLPWAFPVLNAATGEPEYRLATFMFQSVITAVLFGVLMYLFLRRCAGSGGITLLFVLCYSASQVILDSTRYDSLYLRINGFVSMVQILSAVALAAALVLLSCRAVKARGLGGAIIACWVALAVLFGTAGYMEYYVQRHGRLAVFAYWIMEHCLLAIVAIGIWLWAQGRKKKS